MVSVSQIIYSSCVKYNRLKSIIDEAFAGSEANNLNIYIDLYSILKQAFKKEINVENYFDITSCVINTCAHYREFFKRYYNVDTSFYLIFSYNIYNKSIHICPYCYNFSRMNSNIDWTTQIISSRKFSRSFRHYDIFFTVHNCIIFHYFKFSHIPSLV